MATGRGCCCGCCGEQGSLLPDWQRHGNLRGFLSLLDLRYKQALGERARDIPSAAGQSAEGLEAAQELQRGALFAPPLLVSLAYRQIHNDGWQVLIGHRLRRAGQSGNSSPPAARTHPAAGAGGGHSLAVLGQYPDFQWRFCSDRPRPSQLDRITFRLVQISGGKWASFAAAPRKCLTATLAAIRLRYGPLQLRPELVKVQRLQVGRGCSPLACPRGAENTSRITQGRSVALVCAPARVMSACAWPR